jgi:hypothetical protein
LLHRTTNRYIHWLAWKLQSDIQKWREKKRTVKLYNQHIVDVSQGRESHVAEASFFIHYANCTIMDIKFKRNTEQEKKLFLKCIWQ